MALTTLFHVHNAQFPLVTAMVCIGDIYHLLNFFSFSRWLFIGLATLGLIVHRHRHPELRSPFKVMQPAVCRPLIPLIPLFGLLIITPLHGHGCL